MPTTGPPASYFNSRPCERGDWSWTLSSTARSDFNSRPCERGDIHHRKRQNHSGGNFNSRPCERGDPSTWSEYSFPAISIHAPARGATGPRRKEGRRRNFNSRPCERGDGDARSVRRVYSISIHAPARGATFHLRRGLQQDRPISIHAPARGATTASLGRFRVFALFQFTPLREGRHHTDDSVRLPSNFNSRPCERGDLCLIFPVSQCFQISIHAPARGATAKTDKNASELYCNCDKNIMGFKENDNCCREMACFSAINPCFFAPTFRDFM